MLKETHFHLERKGNTLLSIAVWLLGVALALHPSFSGASMAIAQTPAFVTPVEYDFQTFQQQIPSSFQQDIDNAFIEIMRTQIGQSICQQILGGQPEAIAFHLGVSKSASEQIAQGCHGASPSPWVQETSYQDIRKLNIKPFQARKYTILSAETTFPIESWTDPFTNTTVLLAGRDGISHERLVQLLAHEMAVYFDSKADPAHPDAQLIPALRDLQLIEKAPMNPLVAVTNPLTAHTLTFVRALQVEYSIVNELIASGKIVPPKDHDNQYLQYLISPGCTESCLEYLILDMRQSYLQISLPLLAFAPHFRALLAQEIPRLNPNWSQDQWARMQAALNTLPVEFLKTQFTGNPIADLQRVFVSDDSSKPAFQTVSRFLGEDLFPLEWQALTKTSLPSGQTFLEFMKTPLLSGYNILLSSGPRVRVTTGNTE